MEIRKNSFVLTFFVILKRYCKYGIFCKYGIPFLPFDSVHTFQLFLMYQEQELPLIRVLCSFRSFSS